MVEYYDLTRKQHFFVMPIHVDDSETKKSKGNNESQFIPYANSY